MTRLTHLAVSGLPGGGEAVSGVGDVDGRSCHRGPSDVKRWPGAWASLPAGRTDYVGPVHCVGSIGELGPRSLVPAGLSRTTGVTSAVGRLTHRHGGGIN